MIDFSLWSFGADLDGRTQLVNQLMNAPSIWIPYIVAGPPLLYIGLSFHAWSYIKTHTYSAIITLFGSMIFGMGQMILNDRIIVLIGFIIFSIGLIILAYRREVSSTHNNILENELMTQILD